MIVRFQSCNLKTKTDYLRIPESRGEDNIKIELQEIMCRLESTIAEPKPVGDSYKRWRRFRAT
jgi:hypothetical protein